LSSSFIEFPTIEAMQSDQLYYFATIGLEFQQTCLLKLSHSFVPRFWEWV